jgi:hypothetical protein
MQKFVSEVRDYKQPGKMFKQSSVKCRATHVQAWTDPESSRRFRLPDFKKIGA